MRISEQLTAERSIKIWLRKADRPAFTYFVRREPRSFLIDLAESSGEALIQTHHCEWRQFWIGRNASGPVEWASSMWRDNYFTAWRGWVAWAEHANTLFCDWAIDSPEFRLMGSLPAFNAPGDYA